MFYEFTRAEGYLGLSNSNFIVIVIASSVWILVQWFNGSNKKEELSWDKTKTKTKSRYSPPQPQKKPLTSALTEEEDEQFGNCILRLNTLLAIVLQIVQQNLMFRKLWCEEPVRILHSCELSLTVLERNCRAVTLEDSRKLYPSLVRCGQCQGERGVVFWILRVDLCPPQYGQTIINFELPSSAIRVATFTPDTNTLQHRTQLASADTIRIGEYN